jgi:hypothetical protein
MTAEEFEAADFGQSAETGTTGEPVNPLNALMNEDTAKKVQQAVQTAKAVTERFGTERVLIGGGMVMLLAGGAIYLSNQSKGK